MQEKEPRHLRMGILWHGSNIETWCGVTLEPSDFTFAVFALAVKRFALHRNKLWSNG